LSGVQPPEEVENKVDNGMQVTFHSTSCAIMIDKEELKHHLTVIFAYHFFVEHVQTVMLN
jgi:hypothetical protein